MNPARKPLANLLKALEAKQQCLDDLESLYRSKGKEDRANEVMFIYEGLTIAIDALKEYSEAIYGD